jgi:hypothetical protein
MSDWQPIETYRQEAFDGDVVLLRDEHGNEAEGSWGWDEDYDDGYSCAWHKGDTFNPLGFEPTEWRPLDAD